MQESQLLYLLMTLSIGQPAALPQHPQSPQISHDQPGRAISPGQTATPAPHLRRHLQSTPHGQITGLNSGIRRVPDTPHTAHVLAANRPVVIEKAR